MVNKLKQLRVFCTKFWDHLHSQNHVIMVQFRLQKSSNTVHFQPLIKAIWILPKSAPKIVVSVGFLGPKIVRNCPISAPYKADSATEKNRPRKSSILRDFRRRKSSNRSTESLCCETLSQRFFVTK